MIGEMSESGQQDFFNFLYGRSSNFVHVTDPRDIEEIKKRKRLKTFMPPKNELYSVNPNFDGVYS